MISEMFLKSLILHRFGFILPDSSFKTVAGTLRFNSDIIISKALIILIADNLSN